MLAFVCASGCGRALGLDDLTFNRDADAPEAGARACTSHAECMQGEPGPQVCRNSRCLALTNYDATQENREEQGDCRIVLGETNLAQSREPFLFGVLAMVRPIAPLSTPAVLNYRLGVQEFSTLGGLPIGGESHLPVGVVCNTDVTPERIERSLDYLVDELGVSSVIATVSDAALLTTSFEHLQRKAKDVFFLSPFTGSDVLTSFPDNDLLWHMMPDVRDVAAAYLPLVSRIEEYINPAPASGARPPIRLALVVASDYAKFYDIGRFLHERLLFNGKSVAENADNYLLVHVSADYVNPDSDLSAQRDQLRTFSPHLIVSAAGPELLKQVMPRLEETWPADEPRPFYLLAPDQVIDDSQLLATMKQNDRYELERRVAGVNIAAAPSSDVYDAYLDRLKGAFADTVGLESSENFYDALYFSLYAAAASTHTAEMTGKDVAKGMRRLLSGISYEVGPGDLLDALGYLRDDPERTITLQGTLGPPDFHENGVRRGTGSVWCIERIRDPSSGDVSWGIRFDVLRHDPEQGTLSGTFPCLEGF